MDRTNYTATSNVTDQYAIWYVDCFISTIPRVVSIMHKRCYINDYKVVDRYPMQMRQSKKV